MVSKKKEPEPERRSLRARPSHKKQKAEPASHDAKPPSHRKPPQRGAAPTPAPATATKAQAAAPQQQHHHLPAAPYQPETSELERKRLQVADELRNVEKQIFDLETKYLEQSSNFGNAVRGYEGFLGGVGVGSRKIVVKPEERLFSSSSLTGQVVHE